MGLKAIGFFLTTTIFAVTIGVVLANVLRPGAGLPEETRAGLVSQYSDDTRKKLSGGDGTLWTELYRMSQFLDDDAFDEQEPEEEDDERAFKEALEVYRGELREKVEMATAPALAEKSELQKILDILVNIDRKSVV